MMSLENDIFTEIHKDLPQEAPGSNEETRKALSLIELSTDKPYILDIGCGPGRQTLELAENFSADIIAVDAHQYYLDELKKKAREKSLKSKIETKKCSMDSLSLPKEHFDLIWSEGAIYIIGFDNGLAYWREFLKPGGHMVLTEITWLRDDAPHDLKSFWNNVYPAMKTIEGNLSAIENHGYNVVEHFNLTNKAWEEYYKPLEKRVHALIDKYKNNEEHLSVLNNELFEIELYRKYSDYYGYTFFVIQKTGS